MDFEILETISGLPPDQQLDALIEKVEDLKIYIKRGHLQPEFLPLFYEILASISPSTETTFAHMFLALATVDFYNVTKEFIMNLPLVEDAKKVDNNRFWTDPNCFFLNVSKTLNTLIGELPNTAVDHLPSVVKYILYTLTNIENRHGIIFDSGVKQAYEDIRMRLDKIVSQYQLEEEDRRKESAVPREAFRDIHVYPSAWEINSDTRIFLRKNLIKGKYDSVDDYLDVQFRLIREDFVAPLRNDLCAYLAGTPEKSLNIKVHKNVRIYGVKLHNRETGYLIRIFRSDAIPSGDLSDRFMNGALLCLSQDNFHTVCFGRVLALAPKEQKDLLRCGCLLLSIPNEEYLQINASYTVIECSVYFEPYYHVMNAIQSTHNVPMSKYFVDVSTDIDDCNTFYHQLPLEEWDDFGLNLYI